MPVLNFSKWSPGGNTTIFFPAAELPPRRQAALARTALEQHFLGAEQAGFVDRRQRRLRMAGGEFCVNASRAFGALLAFREHESGPRQGSLAAPGIPDGEGGAPLEYEQDYEITVSGWPGPVSLSVRGRSPVWQVTATLRLPGISIHPLAQGINLVRLPGIAHVLLRMDLHPFPEAHEQAMDLLRQTWHLEDEPAVGAIWWRELQGQLEMIPLVHVREARTTCLESSCGSGALALALKLSQGGGRRSYDILQPNGSSLAVNLRQDGEERLVSIGGPVALVALGQVWLPDVTP